MKIISLLVSVLKSIPVLEKLIKSINSWNFRRKLRKQDSVIDDKKSSKEEIRDAVSKASRVLNKRD